MDKIARFWHRKIRRDSKNITIMPAVRWGNILYFILNCYIEKHYLLGDKDQVDNWLQIFPELSRFFIEPEDIKPWDYKAGIKNYHQILGKDFNYEELKSFVENFFLGSEPVRKKYRAEGLQEKLYINVRRGDYYTEEHAPIYGFNIPLFLECAIYNLDLYEISEINVISDDIPWCRQNLSHLDFAGKPVTFLENLSPEESFLTLATAKNIILSNSTFCYWAAYIATFLHGGAGKIIGPAFGNRHDGYYRPLQYLPEWGQIEDFDYETPFF